MRTKRTYKHKRPQKNRDDTYTLCVSVCLPLHTVCVHRLRGMDTHKVQRALRLATFSGSMKKNHRTDDKMLENSSIQSDIIQQTLAKC